MESADQKIRDLEERIDRLVKTQISFQSEVAAIRDELRSLRQAPGQPPAPDGPAAGEDRPRVPPGWEKPPKRPPVRPSPQPAAGSGGTYSGAASRAQAKTDPVTDFFSKHTDSARNDLEKFIGENLISKIGILVLIIGIGIGVKYSIDNNLISPLTRVILAYLLAFGLVGVAIALKPRYLNFSAGLISGGMATMYFVTYFAFTAYGLIGRLPAFGLMAMCTVFTVVAALLYSREVIAHIGLVGAYAVPFLISTDSGNYLALFIYVAMINAGILAVSVRKYWPSILYTASLFTWLIYGAWFVTRYTGTADLNLALLFAAVFFAILYASALCHRLFNPGSGKIGTSGLVLANSFVFYGFGYSILSGNESTAGVLGLYTAGHSALHLAAAGLVGRMKQAPGDVVQVLVVLVLTFASIAIPVQLDGNQVTMAWSVEAAILFWFGRARGVRLFELYSYPLMLIATGSIFADWGTVYFDRILGTSERSPVPIANGNFITALVYIAAFAAIFAISRDRSTTLETRSVWARRFGYVIVALAIFVFYNTLRMEVGNYFYAQILAAGIDYSAAAIIRYKSAVWQISYTLVFLAGMGFVNLFKVRSAVLGHANVILGIAALALAATGGMVSLFELREGYLRGHSGFDLIAVRYILYAAAAILLLTLHRYSRDTLLAERLPAASARLGFEATAYSFAFVAASCELVNTMAQLGIADATKLGLSIFWGIYALFLIIVGIAWNRKHLRIAAICLIGVTLAKLFFYDVADLDTIPRTILFVTLGLTLLVISFLYNKYKNAIFGFAGESEE